MTITLRVGEVLRNPTPFVTRFRLAVDGVLLSDDDFRVFQSDGGGRDEQSALRSEDALAASRVREALPQPPPAGWWYFGRAMLQAWTRADPGGWVLHTVVSIRLDELGGDRPVRLDVRPCPWGWDRFL